MNTLHFMMVQYMYCNSLGKTYAKKRSAEILEKKAHTVSPWKFSCVSFFDCAFDLAKSWCVTNLDNLDTGLQISRHNLRFGDDRQEFSHQKSTSNDEIDTPSSHNHVSVENGCISNIRFLSLKGNFPLNHDYGRKGFHLWFCTGQPLPPEEEVDSPDILT